MGTADNMAASEGHTFNVVRWLSRSRYCAKLRSGFWGGADPGTWRSQTPQRLQDDRYRQRWPPHQGRGKKHNKSGGGAMQN